jgi:hypothetical protein
MTTRGFYGFRYKKKYYMVYNPYDSYFLCLGKKLLMEVRHMIKYNNFELWESLFCNLKVIDINSKELFDKELQYIEYNNRNRQSFIGILNSGYIFIEPLCLIKINYHELDGQFFYILDFDKKRFVIKEIGFHKLKYNLFNGEIDKVYFDNSDNESSSSSNNEEDDFSTEESCSEDFFNDVDSVS